MSPTNITGEEESRSVMNGIKDEVLKVSLLSSSTSVLVRLLIILLIGSITILDTSHFRTTASQGK